MTSFVDTNVAVYAFDRAAGAKRRRTLALLADTSVRLVASAQVLNEFYVTVTRKLPEPPSPAVALDAVRELARLTVVPTDLLCRAQT